MAESAVNSKSEDSIPNAPTASTKNTNTAVIKRKSCRGCLYYSSNSRNPLCVGLSRSLPNVPEYITQDSHEGKSPVDFRYGCAGYSLYQNSDGQHTQLPVCAGFEVIVDRKVNASDSASLPFRVLNKEDGYKSPQHRLPKPVNATGGKFLSRFSRNANVVGNGVVKMTRRVGNELKQSVEYALLSYRKRPK